MRKFLGLLLFVGAGALVGCGDAGTKAPEVPAEAVNTPDYEKMMNESAGVTAPAGGAKSATPAPAAADAPK